MAKNDPAADRAAQAQADYDAAIERQSAPPTPTQEENDRAKLGFESLADLDNKESADKDSGDKASASKPKG